MTMSNATVQEIKDRATTEAIARHEGTLPEGYTVAWRQYGRYGGKWRGVGPNGWVEAKDRDLVEDEVWWMVAADENDAEYRAYVRGFIHE